MRLHEIADLLGLKLQVEGSYYPDQNNRVGWSAKFEYVEVKNGGLLTSECGFGSTPRAALKDYISKIAGQQLVIHAYNETKRQLFKLPKGVTP